MTSITSSTSSSSALTSAQSMSLIQSITGLNVDTNSLVSSLVSAEGQAVFNQINNQTSAINTKISGLGSLNSALASFQSSLSSLQTGSVFQTDTATSSNQSILTVTPGSGAVAASHTIEVQSLATAQSSITNTEFANSSAVVGTGSLTFTTASGSTFTASIPSGSSNDTLANWVTAINNASGNNSVSASIVNVDSTTNPGTTISKLVLNADKTGTANAFTVTASDGNGHPLTGNTGLAQLASSNLSNQGGTQTATTNAEFADTSALLNPGSLSFTTASGASFNVSIDSSNNTLAGVVNAINSASGNNSVLASIITDTTTNPGTTLYKLGLNSGSALTVTATDTSGNTQLSQFSSSNLTTSIGATQSSTSNTEFANSSALFDPGTLSFTSGSGSFNVSINNSNNTLAGVVNAINTATGNTSVTAGIQ